MAEYDPNYIPTKTFAIVGQKAVLLNPENELLLLQRSEKAGAGGKWSLAGGGLERKEDPFESLQREIQEETGLSVPTLSPFSLRSYINEEALLMDLTVDARFFVERVEI